MKMKSSIIISGFVGVLLGGVGIGVLTSKTVKEKNEKINKFKMYYNILNQWLILKQENRSLTTYFTINNISSIAIYGMGELGNRLYEELKDSDIKIEYGIDKSAYSSYMNLEVKGIEDDLDSVDAIIVTSVFDFEKIEEELSQKVSSKIISLEDVVFEI